MTASKRLSEAELLAAIEQESAEFKKCYTWLEEHMPASFFEQVEPKNILLIAHSLMELRLSDFFSHILLKNRAFTLSLDSPDADLKILRHYRNYGIKQYRSFISNAAPPHAPPHTTLRITRLLFNDYIDKKEEVLSQEKKSAIIAQVKTRNPHVTEGDVAQLIEQISPLFIKAMTAERLVIALDLFFRAKFRDNCQYEVKYNEAWQQKKDTPSLQLVFAWRNVPKYDFLYRLSKMVYRHGLIMKRVNATYVDSYGRQPILILALGLHGAKGGSAEEEADLPDFFKELVTLKYFEGLETIEKTFVETGLLKGNQGNFVKTATYFIHQALVQADVNMYALGHIEEALCCHPELTLQLVQAFEAKFHPQLSDLTLYENLKTQLLSLVDHLDTGNSLNDERRKNVLRQGMHFIDYTLKTNYYRKNKTAFSFRLDPHYLEALPYDRKEKFPELPFALFFMKGFYFIGFHIRFRDLSRGGLRTVFPQKPEQVSVERSNLFSECYLLAYTQNKKNKDIPEGGAKGVIFLEPYTHLASEEQIVQRELEDAGLSAQQIQLKLQELRKEQKLEYLYQAQRAYIESFLSLINCEPNGVLRAKDILDYYKKPEYIYLGPDENMHNVMIEWIAAFSTYYNYKPGGAFISSKPGAGINHKEFGVTSLGVNVYMEETLRFLGIDPTTQSFTVKMTGGPDGDVAGNEMENLYRYYPKTAKLLASIDISGTIFDPEGLKLDLIHSLFTEGKPLRFYPPEKLSEGGFLLDCLTKKEDIAYAQKTLCYKKSQGNLIEEWLSGDAMNALLRHNVHQVQADVFIPGGGRPKTLNESNIREFLNADEKPTAKVIVEGANLYLTPWARRFLEKLGTLIIKDSSANKGGVICSSFEVLFSLILSEAEFLENKETIVAEILALIKDRAKSEAALLLKTYKETGSPLTDISEWISEKINLYKDELLTYLQTVTLSDNPKDPLIQCLLSYAPPLIRHKYASRLLTEVPDIHKKAIIACHIASRLVYARGLNWAPSLVDVLPLVIQDPAITGSL
jgi:glutamate dehydrogenase